MTSCCGVQGAMCSGSQDLPSSKKAMVQPSGGGAPCPHLVGLDQVEVLPVHAEAMLEVPALLLTPSTEPVCRQEKPLASAVPRPGQLARAGQAGGELTSDHLHVEPQSPQSLLHIKTAFYQLIQRLEEQKPLPTCSPATAGFTSLSGQGDGGHVPTVSRGGDMEPVTPPSGQEYWGHFPTIREGIWGHHTAIRVWMWGVFTTPLLTPPSGWGHQRHLPLCSGTVRGICVAVRARISRAFIPSE